MRISVLSKKIPTIIGILLIITGIFAGYYFVKEKRILVSQIQPGIIPGQIHISNIQDTQFAVSWTTTDLVNGFIKYGGSSKSLEKTGLDDRDQKTEKSEKYNAHLATIKDLEPEKTYFFKIGSEVNGVKTLFDNSGQPYSITTGPTLEQIQETKIINGKVLEPNGQPAKETIVLVSGAEMAPLSVLTDQNGLWSIVLDNARINNLSQHSVFNMKSTILKIKADNGEKNTSASILLKNAFPSAPNLVLAHVPYDFTQKVEKTPTQMIATTANTVTIDNPAEDGEEINTLRPLFQGKGPAQKTLTITLESDPYTTNITVDENGSWSFTPPFDMDTGEHKITIESTTKEGKKENISKNFIILAAGESDLPAITATASGDLSSPSPLPTPELKIEASPSASPITRVTQPTTDGSMPDTGTSLPTILIFLAGITLVTIGFIFP